MLQYTCCLFSITRYKHQVIPTKKRTQSRPLFYNSQWTNYGVQVPLRTANYISFFILARDATPKKTAYPCQNEERKYRVIIRVATLKKLSARRKYPSWSFFIPFWSFKYLYKSESEYRVEKLKWIEPTSVLNPNATVIASISVDFPKPFYPVSSKCITRLIIKFI